MSREGDDSQSYKSFDPKNTSLYICPLAFFTYSLMLEDSLHTFAILSMCLITGYAS